MGFSRLLPLLLTCQALAAPAQEAQEEDGVLQLPLVTVPRDASAGQNRTRRQAATNLDSHGYSGMTGTALGVILHIGTPPQKVIVEPDTASRLFWVVGLDPADRRDANKPSVYLDRKASSSFKNLKGKSATNYGSADGPRTEMSTVSDEVSMGSVSLGKMRFGVSEKQNTEASGGRIVGVLGLLSAVGETETSARDVKSNDFILDHLVQKKAIAYGAFSMALREPGKGALAFGGIDKSKFSGQLEKFPINDPDSDFHARHFITNIKSLSLAPRKSKNEAAQSTVIATPRSHETLGGELTLGVDSGSPGLAVNDYMHEKIMKSLKATYDEREGVLVLPCKKAEEMKLELKLSDKTSISVPLSDLIREQAGSQCHLRLKNHGGGKPSQIWTGQPFLRRSLVVFDYKAKTMHMARGADCGNTIVKMRGRLGDAEIVGKCQKDEGMN